MVFSEPVRHIQSAESILAGFSLILRSVNLEPRVLRLFGQRWVAGDPPLTEEPENSGLEIGGQYKIWSADYGLRTTGTDCGLGIKHGLGIKRELSITDWV